MVSDYFEMEFELTFTVCIRDSHIFFSFQTTADLAAVEKEFDEQFKNWESQFERWKQENANHPDKVSMFSTRATCWLKIFFQYVLLLF